MKISKSLNKINLIIIFIIIFSWTFSYSEEQPVDIWDLEKKKVEEKTTDKMIQTFSQLIMKFYHLTKVFFLCSHQIMMI